MLADRQDACPPVPGGVIDQPRRGWSAAFTRVYVASNQKVKAGDLLLEIDPRDLQVQVDQKQAALKAAEANGELLRASVELFRTQIASAEATAKQSGAETAAS